MFDYNHSASIFSAAKRWALLRDDVVASENDLPSGWSLRFEPGSRVPIVTTNTGQQRRLLISGEAGHPFQNCPDGASRTHDF
ncbi:MAG: hypothetical protein DWQ04_29415 [Chloroflexi bacterium]|nr:MAG: hypothetical protein DWQ04_29415 [Chloroflexota bacterium]